jgi:DNA repair protein RadC
MCYTATISFSIPLAREPDGPGLLTPADAARQCLDLRTLGREVFVLFTLNQKHAVIDRHIISLGSLTETFIHPREVFATAIVDAAAAILLAHNHPSGDPSPSTADQALTLRLTAAAELLGIRLLDHLIIGRSSWVSLVSQERGDL